MESDKRLRSTDAKSQTAPDGTSVRLDHRGHSPQDVKSQPCPAAETIVQFALSDLGIRSRERVASHLLTCSYCNIEVSALREALTETFGSSPDSNLELDILEVNE